MPEDGRKIKGTIHWLSAAECDDIEVDCFGHLFTVENTGEIPEGKTFDDYLNPDSLERFVNAKIEKSAANEDKGERYQFVRTGYFIRDSRNEGVFNRIVTLKDSYKPGK
jgi:glutaminyl-tRNA synthetase